MYKESKCRPTALNATDNHKPCRGSLGLLQIACFHKGGNKYDPEENIRIGYEVYKQAGYKFRPWTTCKLVKGCV